MECDNILKAFTKPLQAVFNKYAAGNIQPGKTIRMDIQEFCECLQDTGIMNDELTEQNVPFFFSQGLRLRVNELDSDKHLQACFTEFLEGFARCCDQASIPDPKDPSIVDRYSQPLHKKLEHAMPNLVKNCTSR